MNKIRLLTVGASLVLAGSLQATTWYVATNGSDSNSGTSTDAPFATPQKAATNPSLAVGDTIYVRGGTYNLSTQLKLTSRSGTAGNYMKLWAYPGEHPVFDFSSTSSGTKAIYLTNDFWYVKGLEIANATDNGIVIMRGGFNIIEGCIIHDSNNDGVRLGGSTGITSNNLILNCDSYRNFQVSSGGDNGDGFAAKNGVGLGNVFKYCRAWYNSDDGWDFYDNDTGNVTIDGCLTLSNGINIWGVSGFSGNGNGFKLGGASTHAHHIVKNSVALDILHDGFDQNHTKGGTTVYNCTAIRCGVNFQFPETPTTGNDVLKNNASFSGVVATNSTLQAVSNSWQNGHVVTAADFQSLDPALAVAPRNADYSLPNNAFARLVAGSDLIDAGVDVGQPYNGTAPDLGAYEFGATSSSPPGASFTASPTNGVEPLVVTFSDISTGTPPLSLSWNLGDSFTTNTAGGASFTHSYAAGTYTVTLVASNSASTSTLVSNNLIVAAAPPPPQNIWISDLQGSEAGFSFDVNGLTSHGLVIIQASDDLTTWTSQYTNPAVTGTLLYFDSSATNSPQRFYKVEEQ